MQITDRQFDQLVDDGYVIIHRFIPPEKLSELQAAQRRVLKTWDEIRLDPPADRSVLVPYPFPDVTMSTPYLDPDLVRLARRFLKTPDIRVRTGCMIARYPGFVSGDTGHIDNGNNSLLPLSESAREFGQLGVWIHLEEVREDQAPLLLVKRKHGHDLSKAEPFVCPPGSIAVFSNYTFHASSTFKGTEGQRFTWGIAFGRADHDFEGFVHYTAHGQHPIFRQVVSSLNAEQRVLLRFPPPGNAYYTAQTLAALEAQYPGWNARGEYWPVD